MILDSYLYSNAGGRPYNQDSVGKKEENKSARYVLADGLGGHQYGELASACAVETILAGRMSKAKEAPEEWLSNRLAQANQNILQLQREKHAQMKSTAAVLLLTGNKAFWAHVGDSRLYYLHRGKLAAVTEDHSVAYRKYREGEITREQIATDEDQNRLLRVLGNESRYEADCETAWDALEEGDGFFLCSDGSWEYLQDEEILIDFLKAESAREWAESMLFRILERVPEEHDNLSMITVRVKKGDFKEKKKKDTAREPSEPFHGNEYAEPASKKGFFGWFQKKRTASGEQPMKIRVLKGGCPNGTEFLVTSQEAVIGSGKECDIIFTDETVKERNCRIFTNNGQKYLEDLNRRSNTILNGMKIYEAKQLFCGDEISMGNVTVAVYF